MDFTKDSLILGLLLLIFCSPSSACRKNHEPAAKVIVVHAPPQERNCPAYCTNGICNEHGSCTCWNGYISTHPLNQICKPSCPKGCINGECTSPNTCSCNAGYIRDISDSTVCNPICFLHCLNGRCVSPNTCACNLGYTKDPTDDSVCNPVCSPPCVNGNCVSPDTCMCNPGYTKDPINTSVCNLNIFSYECKTGYIKHNSLCIPYCPEGCTNGICTAPNTCKCKEGFVEDNENVCIFKNRSYSSKVADGASDHQLHPAADTDTSSTTIPLWVLLVCTAAVSVLVIGTAIYLRYYRRERRPPPYSECNREAGIWITSK